ncbi:MAG: GNAT family N-acetyltransferase [Planctomycetes bacterium]|nr:GNAT family N-acetyltransferase [Planctomycetota bacterium]
MITIVKTPYREREEAIRAIRDEVFVREQQVSPDLEHDGLDSGAFHVLALDQGRPVGTGRVLEDGHIGRIAVLCEYRHRGIATRLVETLIVQAQSQGCTRVWLASQCQATRLYEKLGFVSDGDVFQEAGIDHIKMSREL